MSGFAIDQAKALFDPLGPWPADRRVAVAVSGGADSLCLAWLAAQWGSPFGLIVDHGLRAESAAEAALTAARLAGFGVPSRILTLAVPHGPGLAARARRARYDALTEAARAANLVDLLLGHHVRDQAETAAMRCLAGSGAFGRAGMAAIVETPWLRLVRPLLGVSPDTLPAILRRAGIAWIEDPSNRDPRFTRARLRQRLNAADVEAALAMAAMAAADRADQEAGVARVLAERVTLYPEGFAVLSSGPILPAALGALLRTIAGRPYPPATESLRRLAAAPGPATLAGVRLLAAGRLGTGLLVVREPASMAPAVPAAAGAVWDGRFRLEGAVPPGLTLGALDGDAAAADTGLPAAVAATLPALRRGKALVAVLPIGYAARSGLGVHAVFSPVLPAAGAAFAGAAAGHGAAARDGDGVGVRTDHVCGRAESSRHAGPPPAPQR